VTGVQTCALPIFQVLFKNQDLDQLATRVDIQGEIKQPETSAMQAISGIIRNAFVEAYHPLFEDLPERPPVEAKSDW